MRNRILVALSGTLCISLFLLVLPFVLVTDATGYVSSKQEAVRRVAQEYFRLSRDPFTALRLEEAIRLVRDNGRLDALLQEPPEGGRASAAATDSDAETPTFVLTFPHTAYGEGSGLKCQSNIVLLNNSETNAHGRVCLYRQDGHPMVVSTNQGQASQFDFALMPGGTYRLETDTAGNLAVGWVEVVSDIQLQGAGTFVLRDGTNSFLSEVGVSDSVRGRSLMIFVDLAGGKDTSFAVCNPNVSTPANLTLELRKLDGTIVESRSGGILGPREQRAKFVKEAFSGRNLTDFQGVLLVKSADTDISVITLRSRGSTLTSLPSVPEETDLSEPGSLLFARVGDGLIADSRIQTSFILLNHSAAVADVTLEPVKETGEPMTLGMAGGRKSVFSVKVPAGGAVELVSDGSTNPVVLGWAKASSTIPIGGCALFTTSMAAGGQFVSQVGVPDSPSSYRLSIFAQADETVNTGFGLTNPGSDPLVVTLRLIKRGLPGQFGTVLKTKTLDLPANSHTARFVTEFFSDVPEVQQLKFEGSIEAEVGSPQLLTALTLRTRSLYYTSLPVAPFTPAAFAPKLRLELATTQAGASPCSCIGLLQPQNDVAVAQATIRFDKGRVNISRLRQKGAHGDQINNVIGFMLIGRIFVLETTEDSAFLYYPITVDGITEVEQHFARLTNLPGDGFTLEIIPNPAQLTIVEIPFVASLCLEPGVIQLPAGEATINITEEYESHEQTPWLGDTLKRSARSTLQITSVGASAPKIHSVTPTRAVGGGEIEITGVSFSATPSANVLKLKGTVGKNRQDVTATILSASPTLLKAMLPENVIGGDVPIGGPNTLSLESGGKAANSYGLSVPFAPIPTMTFGSLAGGASTTCKLDIYLNMYQLALMEAIARPTGGSWILGGFSVGQALGALKVSATTYDLKVKSTDAAKLVLDAVKQGTSDAPAYTVEIVNTPLPELKLSAAALTYSVMVTGDLNFVLDFSKSVFKMPSGSGTNFEMRLELYSVPERTKIRATALSVMRSLQFKTN